MSKGRRRREARRRARQRSEGERPEQSSEDREVEVEGQAGEQQERPERGTESSAARRGRAARKRAQRKSGASGRASSIHVSPWMIATPIMVTVVVAVVLLIVTSGSSGTSVGPAPTPTPDPRVEGLPIDVSFDIEAGDQGASVAATTSFYRPDSFNAGAGEVVEFVLTNTGSVTHNLWLAGADNEYETNDDFGPINLISPGETGRLVVKLDEPDTYLFRCQIHPAVQFGTLTLE